ncbi:hypothetical protein ABVN80_04230 [Acinetobacter baumannii]
MCSVYYVSVSNPQDDLAWMRFLTLWDGIGDVGASKLARELMSISEVEERCERLERHGKVPLRGHFDFETA